MRPIFSAVSLTTRLTLPRSVTSPPTICASPPAGGDFRHDRRRGIPAGVVVDHGPGALAGEGARGRGADAGGATRHQDDLAFEILHRLFLTLLVVKPRG